MELRVCYDEHQLGKKMANHNETRRLHALIANPNTLIDYTEHALDEMAKDEIVQQDVEVILSRSAVTEIQSAEPSEVRWRISGYDGDGRYLEIVVVVEEDSLIVLVITTWHAKSRGKGRKR